VEEISRSAIQIEGAMIPADDKTVILAPEKRTLLSKLWCVAKDLKVLRPFVHSCCCLMVVIVFSYPLTLKGPCTFETCYDYDVVKPYGMSIINVSRSTCYANCTAQG